MERPYIYLNNDIRPVFKIIALRGRTPKLYEGDDDDEFKRHPLTESRSYLDGGSVTKDGEILTVRVKFGKLMDRTSKTADREFSGVYWFGPLTQSDSDRARVEEYMKYFETRKEQYQTMETNADQIAEEFLNAKERTALNEFSVHESLVAKHDLTAVGINSFSKVFYRTNHRMFIPTVYDPTPRGEIAVVLSGVDQELKQTNNIYDRVLLEGINRQPVAYHLVKLTIGTKCTHKLGENSEAILANRVAVMYPQLRNRSLFLSHTDFIHFRSPNVMYSTNRDGVVECTTKETSSTSYSSDAKNSFDTSTYYRQMKKHLVEDTSAAESIQNTDKQNGKTRATLNTNAKLYWEIPNADIEKMFAFGEFRIQSESTEISHADFKTLNITIGMGKSYFYTRDNEQVYPTLEKYNFIFNYESLRTTNRFNVYAARDSTTNKHYLVLTVEVTQRTFGKYLLKLPDNTVKGILLAPWPVPETPRLEYVEGVGKETHKCTAKVDDDMENYSMYFKIGSASRCLMEHGKSLLAETTLVNGLITAEIVVDVNEWGDNSMINCMIARKGYATVPGYQNNKCKERSFNGMRQPIDYALNADDSDAESGAMALVLPLVMILHVAMMW